MAWAQPQFTRSQVDAAGGFLVRARDPMVFDEWDDEQWAPFEHALEVINNWRSSHSYPLQVLKMTLLGRAKKVDSHAIVAQRLKRLESISVKLAGHPHMQLSQMQDIGGCRAVLPTVEKVDELVKAYEASVAKNPRPHDRPQLVKKYDYITCPKTDGYRSVHFVYKYASKSKPHAVYTSLRIEIQIRSQLQHAWATAVETISTFTGQALKSNIGSDEWKRFFALAGSAIALRERRPLVPGTPTEKAQIADKLRNLTRTLNAETVLQSWGDVLQTTTNTTDAVAFLLVLDPEQRTTAVTGYSQAESPRASQAYLAVEREIKSKPGAQAVLVSVESLQALRSAFPNYYLDTTAFVDALRLAIQE